MGNLARPELLPNPLCILGCGGFIGSHLVERLLTRADVSVVGVDTDSRKIAPLLDHPRLTYHDFDLAETARLEEVIGAAEAVVNLASLCNPSLYNTRPLDVIESNFTRALPVVRQCAARGKWLVHFSTCEVYGKTLAGYAPPGSDFRDDPDHYVLSEDRSPLILGPIDRQRWTYSAAKQLLERVIYAEGCESDLRYTIVRPFNFVGPRMDFIPGVDGEGLPRVVACFMAALLRRQPLKLVAGGISRRTFIYIEDAIDAIMGLLARPEPSQGRIFNIGNPANEVTIAELARLMIEVFCEKTGGAGKTVAVDPEEFYGEGYDDSDRRVPDIRQAQSLLDWTPATGLRTLLEKTIEGYLQTYGDRLET